MPVELSTHDEHALRTTIRQHGTTNIPLQCGLMAKVTSLHKSRSIELTVTLMRPGNPVQVYRKDLPSMEILFQQAASALERALNEVAA